LTLDILKDETPHIDADFSRVNKKGVIAKACLDHELLKLNMGYCFYSDYTSFIFSNERSLSVTSNSQILDYNFEYCEQNLKHYHSKLANPFCFQTEMDLIKMFIKSLRGSEDIHIALPDDFKFLRFFCIIEEVGEIVYFIPKEEYYDFEEETEVEFTEENIFETFKDRADVKEKAPSTKSLESRKMKKKFSKDNFLSEFRDTTKRTKSVQSNFSNSGNTIKSKALDTHIKRKKEKLREKKKQKKEHLKTDRKQSKGKATKLDV
jgi:hypothetical protein